VSNGEAECRAAPQPKRWTTSTFTSGHFVHVQLNAAPIDARDLFNLERGQLDRAANEPLAFSGLPTKGQSAMKMPSKNAWKPSRLESRVMAKRRNRGF
jgi:hypothetical protein